MTPKTDRPSVEPPQEHRMSEQSSVNDAERKALDSIPEFSTEYDHLKFHYDRLNAAEQARHGAAMFSAGVLEGMRQAIHAIEQDRKEMQPSREWSGMKCAVAAIERAIGKSKRDAPKTDRPSVEPPPNEFDVLSPEREKPLNPWQPERDPIRLAVLGKLAEELAEASAIVARCIIQGIDEAEPVTGKPNALALQNELADVSATWQMAAELFGLDVMAMLDRAQKKRNHLARWHALIRKEPTNAR